ncbi:MAG: response regulator [Bacteroidota bacterium]
MENLTRSWGPILIIDDEVEFFELFERFVDFAEVEHASSPKKAAALLTKNAYELIIVDLKLDERKEDNSIRNEDETYKGLEYIKELKKRYPHTPVMVISKYEDFTRVLEAGKNGADVYRWKEALDLTEPEFRSEIKNLIKQKRKKDERRDACSNKIWGISPSIKGILVLLQDLATQDKNLVILGNPGFAPTRFAKEWHIKSMNHLNKDRSFIMEELHNMDEEDIFEVLLGLANLFKSNHFIKRAKKGTLYIPNLELLSRKLQSLLISFIKEGNYLDIRDSELLSIRFAFSSTHDLSFLKENGLIDPEFLNNDLFAFVKVPPLKERREDIRYIIKNWMALNEMKITQFNPQQLLQLAHYHYPYNEKELFGFLELIKKNHIENSEKLGTKGQLIQKYDPYIESIAWDSIPVDISKPEEKASKIDFNREVAIVELTMIDKALDIHEGNKGAAAAMLNGRTPDHIRHMINKHKKSFPGLIKQFLAIAKSYKL